MLVENPTLKDLENNILEIAELDAKIDNLSNKRAQLRLDIIEMMRKLNIDKMATVSGKATLSSTTRVSSVDYDRIKNDYKEKLDICYEATLVPEKVKALLGDEFAKYTKEITSETLRITLPKVKQ